MCRIFCSPSSEQRFNKAHFWEFCKKLEKSLGKDGNGIYNYTTGEVWKHHDKMPIEANIKGGVLFHTRYATHGLVRDYNCQPFNNERYVFVHNGGFTDIDSYAKLLGFTGTSKKYSDSYMMAWVLEKVGIFNFYITFKSKYYGIIVVYDKKIDKTYMMNSGGSFEYGIFDDGIYIYGSSMINFWDIKEKAKSFERGLYILSGDGFTQLDKISPYNFGSTYNGGHSGYGSGGYYGSSGYGSGNRYIGQNSRSYLKDKKKEKKNKRKIDYFANKNTDEDDTPPQGLENLFSTKIPAECIGCNWFNKGKCWFGGVERSQLLLIKDGEGARIECNTLKSKLEIEVNCGACKEALMIDGKWEVYEEVIMCKACREYAEEFGNTCETCENFHDDSFEEPCCSCWSGEGVPKKWSPVVNSCEGCYFATCGHNDFPCSVCDPTPKGLSEWTSKEPTDKCEVCGGYANADEEFRQYGDNKVLCEDCRIYSYDERYSEDWDEWDTYRLKR